MRQPRGWLYHWGTRLTLIGESLNQVAEARREQVRIGIDSLAGVAAGDITALADGQELRSYPVSDFAGPAAAKTKRDTCTFWTRPHQRLLRLGQGRRPGAPAPLKLPELKARSRAATVVPNDLVMPLVLGAGAVGECGVDWYLNGEAPESLGLLRREVKSYLLRHCAPDSDLDDAELVFAEVVGNAVRHAGGPIWVSLAWHDANPTLTVRDLGPGFDAKLLAELADRPFGLLDAGDEALPDDPAELEDPRAREVEPTMLTESGRGLFLVSHLAPSLEAHTRTSEGMHVVVTLPVTKPAVSSQDPPRHTTGTLPALAEAQAEGGFGKESFLRALVVQLAQALEFQRGPDAADAAVAQVGIDVGGQMEEEFRAAKNVVGRMTPDEMAHCYVRLKHAIDGGFYVIEATPRQIVLGNRRCPFGDVVRQAPSLCRMTSSVFGGIAARNSDDGASVLLEERIAVGDPGCRVIVYLGQPPTETRPHVHRYTAPEP